METRRILLDGVATTVTREGDELVAPDSRRIPMDEPSHLPPIQPSKIICVGRNYKAHATELGNAVPDHDGKVPHVGYNSWSACARR